MTGAGLVGYVMVPLFGVILWILPLVTRPTLQFGVRVPPAYLTAPVIRRERRRFQWRSAVVVICATAVVIAVGNRAPWISRVILIGEMAANIGCYWWAHQRIEKVKSAEGWFAGQRQTVVADTSWRTEPQRFPIGWLVPALVVIVATVIVGVLRYPHLPPYLTSSGGRQVATSPITAFAVVFGQVYVTGIGSGLLALVYRSRPDIDTADPAASLRGYRKALGAVARALLILLGCIDLTLLLSGLRQWQVYRLPDGGGTAVLLLPVLLGLVAFFVVLVRAARERARATPAARATDRDDDRFWKAGLVYVNRDDPAVLVTARFGFGWTVNAGNRTAWLLIAAVVAIPVGLVIIKLSTGT